ncbi:MAG: DNA-protecting protein DprA [Saprospiraceae bacterium]|nr:DNA-protecting protein DprA [Saprospiraceae bacterium]
MMSEQEIIYKLALSFIPNIGAVNAKNLISYLGGIDKVFSATKSQILKIPGIGEKKYNDIRNNDALLLAEQEFERIKKLDLDVIFYFDAAYPQRLKQQNDCPLLLYASGNIDFNPKRTVAVIGTRSPSIYGQSLCEKIIDDLLQFNVTIISGLAYGIDTIAHRSAIKNKMQTIGILGNGLNAVYPSSNHSLAQKMKLNGGLISEYPIETIPDRENFPRRNRIIASMSDVVIVVESARKGGSFITAEFANNYSKDVFAIPGRLTDVVSAGCNHLIKTHKAHLYTSIEDIAYINRWDAKPKSKQLSLLLDLTEEEKTIYQILKEEKVVGMDTLLYKTQLQLSILSSTLINLEFNGLIKSLPGKKYILGA